MISMSRLKVASLGPVLSSPVLIIESDDWGPGSETQVQALEALRALLRGFKDCNGHPAVMTIGVILSLPDSKAVEATREYHASFLDDPHYRPIVETLKAGAKEGVFDLQLHGLAHFWPANFMAAWEHDEAIRRWLAEDGWRTERLPAWLQSRWIAAFPLPSRPLPLEVIRTAVREEVACFRRCFGGFPKVAVPPTFVWNIDVESAYAEAGIEVLITPGRRYAGRDRKGGLTSPERSYFNGERLACGLRSLVRDVYFEPALQHRPDAVLAAIADKWRRREPALLETHRFNFLDGQLNASLEALKVLLEGALTRFPNLRFSSSYELATGIADFATASRVARIQTAWRRLRT